MAKAAKKAIKKKAAKNKKAPKIEERIYLDMSFEDAIKLAATTPLKKNKKQK